MPTIAVMGVGGGGGNAVRSMIEGDVQGVQFMAANTDIQALEECKAELKIHLGSETTHGYGAGTDPKIGRRAAEESLEDIRDAMDGVDMLFLTAGMGGGTGTGASPVIARVARELGILTVGVMTTPFAFEGPTRMEVAQLGIKDAQEQADTLLLISNQNLFRLENGVPHLLTAFESVNGILRDAIRGVVDLVTRPGMINTDFADLVMALRDGGLGVIGEGTASGADRARKAAIQAATNPLLDGVTLEGASRLLINVTGGRDLSPDDFDEAVNHLRNLARDDAQMKVGASFDPEMEGSIRVYIAASGVERGSCSEAPASASRTEKVVENREVREIRVPEAAEQPKETELILEAKVADVADEPSVPSVDELSAGLKRPESVPAASATQARHSSRAAQRSYGDDDWDDGIEIDIRSQSSSRTVAASPTFAGGVQEPTVRPEKDLQPRFRPGYKRQAVGSGAGGQGGQDTSRNRQRSVPTPSGTTGQKIPARGLNTRPGGVGVTFSGNTGPRSGAMGRSPGQPATRKSEVASRAPAAGSTREPGSPPRRDLGIRAVEMDLPKPDPQVEVRKTRVETETPSRGVSRRSPGLLARLLSRKE